MSESKFTPGPWAATSDRVFSTYGQSSGDGHVLQESEKWMIADLIGSGSYGGSEFIELGDDDRQYNAKLIAAAPELLSALEDLADYVDEMHRIGHIERPAQSSNARAAIKKATA